ncbi:hypothetical protein H5T53_05500 [Candidatus Bipolaricaulota bacterium]|nr:hypothetical protein [Candidatus Bipolaricaulota bacterium]
MGDGFYGAPEGAPYDRIEATVGCSDLSPQGLMLTDLHTEVRPPCPQREPGADMAH